MTIMQLEQLRSLLVSVGFMLLVNAAVAADNFPDLWRNMPSDTIPKSILKERSGDYLNSPKSNRFDLKDPSIIDKKVEYDPTSGQYIISEKIGSDYFRTPSYMSFEEYQKYKQQQQQQSYFRKLAGVSSGDKVRGGVIDPVKKVDLGTSLIDRLFGGSTVSIVQQGNIDLTFGGSYQNIQNPILTQAQRSNGFFDFDMGIQMNVTGKIGEKLNLSTNFNNRATFNFENQIKLKYDTPSFTEDEIVKKLEAGNVSLPLRSSLIQGSQALFGLKTELQFGKLRLTGIVSQQKSKRENLQIQGGSQVRTFEVPADEYDENRHFFLSQYNRNNFEPSLKNLPRLNSLFKITRIELWVTNDRNVTQEVRDIVAMYDLGEDQPYNQNTRSFQKKFKDITGALALTDNRANDLYATLTQKEETRHTGKVISLLQTKGYQPSIDYEKVRARLLDVNREYTFNEDLGFVSLNISLRPEQVLGVAFEYTYNGVVHRVGEFTNGLPKDPENQSVVFVKLLKGTTPNVTLPIWDLMMKNIYSLGAGQLDGQDFRLDVFYDDAGKGSKRFLPGSNIEGKPLLNILNLDNLNQQNDPQPDGQFDFVPGVTVNTKTGRIMFPVLEPFGQSLKDKIVGKADQDKYAFDPLYRNTITKAREFTEQNRYVIRGSYRSSISSEISLGSFNLPQGSVRVSAGASQLTEGQDYEVNYSLGTVRILNPAYVQAGQPLSISFEDNTLFGLQQRSMLGLRADYEIKKNFNIGGTAMKLFERPFTQKVNLGDDPINNTIYGADVNYNQDAPWLTNLVDKLPFIQTKEPSSLSFYAEGAILQPGHSGALNQVDEGGSVFYDDFEGGTSSFDLRQPAQAWAMASVPQGKITDNNGNVLPELFPESSLINDLTGGVNRAALNWYRLDRAANDDAKNPYTSPVSLTEIFPNYRGGDVLGAGLLNIAFPLDLRYEPTKRGPYNFDVPGGVKSYSKGLTQSGNLMDPQTRWAGIMRGLTNTDFEQANVEAIEFWMLSPFLPGYGAEKGGDLYLNLGNISEDILRDSRQYFENGLPTKANQIRTENTNWSVIPTFTPTTNGFDLQERESQDVGLDGVADANERVKFADYLQKVKGGVSTTAYQNIEADPSNDNYKYYSDYPDKTSTYQRYSKYNGVEGNSKQPEGTSIFPNSNMPDMEEINRDNNMNESEAYYQYKIALQPDPRSTKGEIVESEYVIDKREDPTTKRIWYRFKIPIAGSKDVIGGLTGLRSIRFIRMFLHNFEEPVTLRFATLELVRNQWRKYARSLAKDEFGNPVSLDSDCLPKFDVTAVNVEQNSGKKPYNYMLPPGVQREITTIGAATNNLQNEQSLALKVKSLCDGDARSIFKLQKVDMRVFKRLKMFVHAEALQDIRPEEIPKNGELKLFVRIGSDFEKNYYQYEIPMTISTRPITGGITPTDTDKLIVWDPANNIDIVLEALTKVKANRNLKAGADITRLYQESDPAYPKNKIGIVGNPNVGNVTGMMIGIRNPKDNSQALSTEVWINELRMNGFDERGGQAALMRVDMKLADLGNVSLSGNYSSIGWGALHQKVAQRSRFDNLQYDVATTLELGKFLPRTSGIRVPFYYQYSSTEKAPEFNPYDLDVKTRSLAATDPTKEAAIEKTTIRSMNFTNVRKERTDLGKTPMPWDIENFSVTYAQSQTNVRTPIMETDNLSQTKGALDYSYSAQPKYFTPFKKIITNDKYLKLLSEFNINPVPSTLTFNTSLDRNLGDRIYRFTDDVETYRYTKRFTWGRNYNLAWDLAKSLRMSFNATNMSVIDEINGDPNRVEARQAVWNEIKKFGRNKNYNHNFTASYTLPFKQIPYMDWIQVKASYGTTYGWSAAPLNALELGNVIQNSQNKQLNGDFAFDQFYNQFPYLKKINEPLFNENSGEERTKSKKRQRADKTSDTDPANTPTPDAAATTDTPKPANKSQANKRRSPRGVEREAEKGSVMTQPKTEGNAVEGIKLDKIAEAVKKKKEKKEREITFAEKLLLKPLMMIRRGRGTYSETYNSSVPGFTPNSELLGMSNGFGAPGAGYAFGAQPTTEWLDESARQGWVTKELLLNQQVQQNYTQNIDARLTLEPIDEFRIDVDATRNYTRNHTELFKVPEAGKGFEHLAQRDMGTFTVSYFTMPTLFEPDITTIFKKFEDNRAAVSAALNPTAKPHIKDATFGSYKDGFGRYQQEVLVPAFLAAYTNTDPLIVAKSTLFNTIPRPNWRLSYTGLSKVPALKSIFQNITLTHGYKSTLTTNSYNTNLGFDPVNPLLQDSLTRNYYTRLIIPGLTISEQMSPVIGVDIRTKSDMSIRYDFRKTRNLLMSFVDYQLNETKTTEHVFGYTYRLKNVKIPFLYPKSQTKGKKKKDLPGNDMNIKVDFSLRDDISRIFLLDLNSNVASRGARTLRFSPSIDYTLNKKLNLRLFIDHNDTYPYTPNSFPIRTTRGGLTVRFSL